jgi:hypothetical protein
MQGAHAAARITWLETHMGRRLREDVVGEEDDRRLPWGLPLLAAAAGSGLSCGWLLIIGDAYCLHVNDRHAPCH